MVQAPENIQSLNRYSYVMNNPLNATDPSGYVWVTLVVMALKAIATYVGVSSAIGVAIGYALTAYKFYGYYQMARGVLAASKGNSAMIGKFVGGMIKSYAKSMAINGLIAGVMSIAKTKSQSEDDSDLIKVMKKGKVSLNGYDSKNDNALNLALNDVNDKNMNNKLFADSDKAAEWLHNHAHPISELYNAEVGANIYAVETESGTKFSIGKIVTSYHSGKVFLSNSIAIVPDSESYGSWHSHGKNKLDAGNFSDQDIDSSRQAKDVVTYRSSHSQVGYTTGEYNNLTKLNMTMLPKGVSTHEGAIKAGAITCIAGDC